MFYGVISIGIVLSDFWAVMRQRVGSINKAISVPLKFEPKNPVRWA